MSPLMSAPGLTLDTFKLDWLHIADLGVGADWLGQLFSVLMTKMPGGTKAQRLAELWRQIQTLYKLPEFKTSSQLDDLSETMIKSRDAVAPKLRANAAECRGRMGIGRRLATELLSDHDPFEATVLQATKELWGCYQCLSATTEGGELADRSRRFCTLWVSLEERHEGFHIKPKMHLFQELCEESGPTQPAAHWTYRDEDFGGSIVGLARCRGGPKTPGATGHRVLSRFRARYRFPQIV